MDNKRATQYLTFELGGAELAIAVLEVRQIIEHVTPTRVPQLPPVVRGVINLRGSVVPVIDLACKLSLEAQPVSKRSCIVIVEAEAIGQLGVLADAVCEVIDLPPADLLPTPGFGVAVRADYLLGLGKVRDRLVLVLDTRRLLSAEELLAAAAIPEAPAPAPAEAASCP
jgi:purine-binding chemotaxis protein CheW